MPGRASSTIHKLNNGLKNYTIQKCKHSGFELSARVKCSLHQMDKETDYQTRYLRRPQVVKRQLLQHDNKIQEHLQYKQLSQCQQAGYQKGLLDPKSKWRKLRTLTILIITNSVLFNVIITEL